MEFFFDLIQELLELRLLGRALVLPGKLQVARPFGRVKAPVAGSLIGRLVRMHDKLLWRKEQLALHALDARGFGLGVELGHEETLALSQTLVLHLEAGFALLQQALLGELPAGVCRQGSPGTQEGIAQPLRIRECDEAAGRCVEWQNTEHLEDVQLLSVAARTVDIQLVTHGVDLLQREVAQHRVEDLWEAQPFLSPDDEAGDGLPFQQRVGELGGAVTGNQQRTPTQNRRGGEGGHAGLGVLVTCASREGSWAPEGALTAEGELSQRVFEPWA